MCLEANIKILKKITTLLLRDKKEFSGEVKNKVRMQTMKLSLVVILSVALMTGSFTAVEAAVVNNKKVLPDFIEGSIAMMYPNASDAKLAEIRDLWVKQIELRENMIASTNGAVLKFQPSALTSDPSYFIYLTKIEPLRWTSN